MGNAHLSLFPYEPLPTGDGELIVVAGNDGQFRRLVRGAGRRRNSPTTSGSPPSGGATTTARSYGRCCSNGWPTRSAQEWFAVLTEAGIPCGPINDVRGGVELAEPSSAWTRSSRPAASRPYATRSRLSADTRARYDLPPPALDADGDEVRAWLGLPATYGADRDRTRRVTGSLP